jgi:hypothetical protein
MGWVILIIICAIVLAAIISEKKEQEKIALMSPEEQQKYLEEKQARSAEAKQYIEHGQINTAMVCPHCQSIGKIRTKEVNQKKGVSGGKATAAVLTGGLSLLAVGLSRKEGTTQAHCDKCSNTWFF